MPKGSFLFGRFFVLNWQGMIPLIDKDEVFPSARKTTWYDSYSVLYNERNQIKTT